MMNSDINFYSIFGYTLKHLPYYVSVLEQAFPNFEINQVEEDCDNNVRSQIQFRRHGEEEIFFAITPSTSWDEQSQAYRYDGYAGLVYPLASSIKILEKYQVAKTLFSDFKEPYCSKVYFNPRETCIRCDIQTSVQGYCAGFDFSPPEGYSGSIKSMTAEQFGDCILTNVYFSLNSAESRQQLFLNEEDAHTLYERMRSEEKTIQSSARELAPPVLSSMLSPIEEIVKKSFDHKKAINAYLRLVNIAVHANVKTKLKQALQTSLDGIESEHPSADDLFVAAMRPVTDDQVISWPIFNVDWKASIAEDLDYAVRQQLGKSTEKTKLPDVSNIPNTAGFMNEEYLTDYAVQLEEGGYDLYTGGLNSDDSIVLILSSLKNRKKMDAFIRDSKCMMYRVAAANQ